MRPRLVIAGAGLGGCTLAQAARDVFDVTVIDCGELPEGGVPIIEDQANPAVTDPHVGYGLGGTTRLWHNGLIEIDSAVFDRHWPFPKKTLEPYLEQAFPLLSGGVSLPAARAALLELRKKYMACGMPDGLLPGLFYPIWPLNVWDAFGLADSVRVVQATVTDVELNANGNVCALKTTEGPVPGDVFVLSAGGLHTPLILRRMQKHHPLPCLQHAGRHYEDHPMTFVGELQSSASLYRLWNYAPAGIKGNLRMPLVVERDGLHISFQMRPSATVGASSRRQKVHSVLNALRRNPWNPIHYVRLLRHPDDLLDILSFVFGVHLPTRHYTLLMVAQMPTRDEVDVWGDESAGVGPQVVKRRWVLSETYLRTLHAAVADVIQALGPLVNQFRMFKSWETGLKSAAHHSGTARLSATAASGVCDADARVHDINNLYVCDGSLIPASGIANTGLTIAALALRLAEHLKATGPLVNQHRDG